jgi:hypothetical protein
VAQVAAMQPVGYPETSDLYCEDNPVQLHRILKDTGTLYLHCDRHAGHKTFAKPLLAS